MVGLSKIGAVLVLLAASLLPAMPVAAAEHMYNGDLAIEGSTDVLQGIDAKARPDGWIPSGHGNNTRYYVYGTWAQHTIGPVRRMMKVWISEYENGNASWLSQDMPVEAGETYVLTHEYRSNVSSTLGLLYKNADGAVSFRWLNTFPASDTWLQVPVRRRFTVPEGMVSVAVYRGIRSVGWLEVGNFTLVDDEDVDETVGGSIIRNGNLLEVDQNNEPVGWKHRSSLGTYRGYQWDQCSTGPAGAPRVPCATERTNFIAIGGPDNGNLEASWMTEDVSLPPQQGTAPRNLYISYRLATAPEPRTRVLFTMADGSKVLKLVAIINTEDSVNWGGPALTATEVPEDAVAFSLQLTRASGPVEMLSKFSDFVVRLVDPGAFLSPPCIIPIGAEEPNCAVQ